MMTAEMRKIILIIARSDFESAMLKLVRLGCVEVTDPDEFLRDPELGSLVERESVALDSYNANQESIALLGTQSSLILTGWMAAQSEQGFAAQMSKFICAWEIETPSPEEHENIPVKLRFPGIFKLFYKGDGKPFNPLRSMGAIKQGDGPSVSAGIDGAAPATLDSEKKTKNPEPQDHEQGLPGGSLEKVIANIKSGAEAECEAILKDAAAQCEQIRDEYASLEQDEYWKCINAGTKEMEHRLEQLKNLAAMESKKQILSTQQEMVDEAFALASKKLLELPERRYAKLCTKLGINRNSSPDAIVEQYRAELSLKIVSALFD